jgi:hypothetical protein
MSGSGLRGSLLGGEAAAQQPAWMSQTVEGSAEYALASADGPAEWNKANARKYCVQMLWEQIRTVSPIAAFLIGYQVRPR